MHGKVRLLQHGGSGGFGGAHGEADTCGEIEHAAIEVKGAAHRDQDALGEGLGISPADLVEKDHKLVAAVPGDEILFADAAGEQSRDPLQQEIAKDVTQAVVQGLKAVESDEEHGGGMGGRIRKAAEAPVDLGVQKGAIRHGGERIVQNGVFQLRVNGLQLPFLGAGPRGEEEKRHSQRD